MNNKILFAFYSLACLSFAIGQNSTVSYNVNAIDCIYNKSVTIPFFDYIYSSVMNCYGDNCNITEYFFPMIEDSYIVL